VRGTTRKCRGENCVAKHITLCWHVLALDGSATDTASVALLRGEERVHLMLANPPWRQLRERAEKIPGDKKHVERSSRGVIGLRSSIQHRTALTNGELS
jgi:hypothetical protein